MRRFPSRKLMLITRPDPDLFLTVSTVLEAGVGVIQLRDKHATDTEIFDTASRLLPLLSAYRVPLIINDRLQVARRLGVGLHVGADDVSPREARKVLGPQVLLGLTIHNRIVDISRNAPWIDYVGCGPVYPTSTKSDARDVIGLNGLLTVCRHSSIPVVAIGGISPDNIGDVWRTGAEGVAACSAIFDADDKAVAVSQFHYSNQ